MIEVRSLTDGGQTALDIAGRIAEFIAPARTTLELALYDIRLSDPAAGIVRGALEDAAGRGVAVRLAYNHEERRDRRRPIPPPPRTRVALVEGLPFPTCPIPGEPDLMHHKYVVRDREAVWTRLDQLDGRLLDPPGERDRRVESPALAGGFAANFEELWRTRDVERTGGRDARRRRGRHARAGLVHPGPRRGALAAHRRGDRLRAQRGSGSPRR